MKTILTALIVTVSVMHSYAQWTVQQFYPDYNDVFFVISTGTGYAAGSGGIIRKSTDYGLSWQNLRTNTAVTFNSVWFNDINTGWAVGANSSIYKTTNGGSNWSIQTSGVTET